MTLIESHMAVNLASDSVSLSNPFSFRIRVRNFELSLSLGNTTEYSHLICQAVA